MKKFRLWKYVPHMTFALCWIAAPLLAEQQDPGTPQDEEMVIAHDVAPFMQRKLAYAKTVLEGLVLRDFDRVAKNAQQISLMSLDTTWQVLQSSEYAEKSAEFRVSANELAEAAKAENLDAATLAYVKMTMNCVNCHKRIPSWQNKGAHSTGKP